jgi:hypothetical protein
MAAENYRYILRIKHKMCIVNADFKGAVCCEWLQCTNATSIVVAPALAHLFKETADICN